MVYSAEKRRRRRLLRSEIGFTDRLLDQLVVDLRRKLRLAVRWAGFRGLSGSQVTAWDRELFCQPQAPWQKGSAENMNGRLQRLLPRKSDVALLPDDELDAIGTQLRLQSVVELSPRKA